MYLKAEGYMPIEVIMDGKLILKNVQENQLTVEWIDEELKKRQLSLKDIVYAVRSSNGSLYIDTYDDHIHSPIDQE
uniref:YetF domain-containing protein n=1 Tax=Bacillus sp. FSL R5-0422 TaxID=2921577 RepID=UPI00406D1E94